jgi:hypothetical protein
VNRVEVWGPGLVDTFFTTSPILTVTYRQVGNLAYRPAFEQAKAEVQAMSEAEVAYFVADFFSQPDQAEFVAMAT